MGKEEIRDFLQHLWKQIHRPILLIWDRLPAHRSRLVSDYIASRQGAIELPYLPAYAPELNPAEYIWAQLKQHELANFCPRNLWHLSEDARSALRSMQRSPNHGYEACRGAGILDRYPCRIL